LTTPFAPEQGRLNHADIILPMYAIHFSLLINDLLDKKGKGMEMKKRIMIIFAILLTIVPVSLQAVAVELDKNELKKYEGEFSSTAIPIGITLKIEGDQLYGQGTGQPPFPLTPFSESEFRFEEAGITITFETDNSGTVQYDAFTLSQGGGKFPFKKDDKALSERKPDQIWSGAPEVGGQTLRIVFCTFRGPDGTLTAVMDSPDQGAKGIPVTDASIENGMVRFNVASIGLVYEGNLQENGTAIEGIITQHGMKIPAVLNLTDVRP